MSQKDTTIELINSSHILEYSTLQSILVSFAKRIQQLENDQYAKPPFSLEVGSENPED